ncbi:MAG: 50S ribosomal protein L29 [Actinomycetia bacterium]|nr:50S ribosomal protein L29 [Actinomycetes bacterium]
MRASDIREQTREELEAKLNDIKKNLFNLKFQKAIGQVQNTQAIGNLNRDIARISTLMREKELGINQELKSEKVRGKKKIAAKKKISVKGSGTKEDIKAKASSESK